MVLVSPIFMFHIRSDRFDFFLFILPVTLVIFENVPASSFSSLYFKITFNRFIPVWTLISSECIKPAKKMVCSFFYLWFI